MASLNQLQLLAQKIFPPELNPTRYMCRGKTNKPHLGLKAVHFVQFTSGAWQIGLLQKNTQAVMQTQTIAIELFVEGVDPPLCRVDVPLGLTLAQLRHQVS